MLRCKEVTRLVAGEGLADGGIWVRLKVRLHLIMCRHCARYVAQIRAIGAKVRQRFKGGGGPADGEDLQRRILESAARSKRDQDSP